MPQPIADQIRSIPMSSELGQSLERAHGFAREQSHRTVTLEHLLLAFTEDPDASAVLQASNIDLLRLGTDVSGYLGRLPDDMRAQGTTEPQPDPELLRVLQAAVQAAQQSRRRQIDGAIVLAAVVGDGKSPAAGLLKAHGLTFEEAIRALQKASAKAGAQPRSKPAAPPQDGAQHSAPSPSPGGAAERPPPPTPADPAPRRVEAALPVPNEAKLPADQPNATAPVPNGRAPESSAQTVDEILAAARARIQQRSSDISGLGALKPEPPQQQAAPEPPPPAAPAPRRPTQSQPSTGPRGDIDQVASSPPPAAAKPAPAPRLPDWTPPAGGAQQAPQPLPQQAAPRRSPPLPQATGRSGDASPRPPLPNIPNLPPQRPVTGAQPPPPWPGAELPQPNGALADPNLPAQRRPGQRPGSQPGQGPLVETIPRRMRVAVPATAHVRISRNRVDGLILLLMKGRGVIQRPEAFLTRALTVRLHAPDGGFWIEANSPETQWVDGPAGRDQESHVAWRWTVTPQESGRGRLHLVVTARMVGHDGVATETSPPDRVIEVTVTGGQPGRLRWWAGVVLTLLLGAVIGRFGGEVWAIVSGIIRRLSG